MPVPLLAAPVVATILAWLSRLMMLKLGVWIVGAMVYLGIYFGTQTFLVGPLIDQAEAYAIGTLAGPVAQWAAFLNVDKFITMVLSAYTAAGAISATKMALFRR